MLYKVITVSAAVFVGVSLQGCSSNDACDFTNVDSSDTKAYEAAGDRCNKCLTDNGGADLEAAGEDILSNCDTMTKTLDAITTCGGAGAEVDITKGIFEIAKAAACANSN